MTKTMPVQRNEREAAPEIRLQTAAFLSCGEKTAYPEFHPGCRQEGLYQRELLPGFATAAVELSSCRHA